MNDSYGTRSLREIIRILFQHWFMLLFIAVVGTGGTYAVCQFVVPTYNSKIGLIFKRPLSKNPISTDKGERALEVFVKAQQQIVMSDMVLARAKVISEDKTLRNDWYKLAREWESVRAQGGGRVALVQQRIDRFLKDDIEEKVTDLLEQSQAEFKDFRDSVKLETPGGEQVGMTESFSLIVKRPAPQGVPESYKNATYSADILADMYIVRYQELQQALNDPALRVMQDVIDAFEKEVQHYIDEYQAFVEANSADIGVLEQLLKSGTEHGVQVVLTEMRKSDAQLALDMARDSAVFTAMKAALPPKVFDPDGVAGMTDEEVEAIVAMIPVEFLKEDIGFSERLKELAKLETKRAEIETQYTDVSRDVQYLREEICLAKRHILQALVAHARALEVGIEARRVQKIANEQLVEETAKEQSEIHKKLAQYARLKDSFQVAQRHFEKLQQEKVDALSNQLRARESVTITKLDKASVPDVNRPVTPKTLIYTVVAFVISCLLGITGAFLVDHYDHTLRSMGEAERYLGVPVLGSVKKRGRGLVVGT